jgi:hypothetical protein
VKATKASKRRSGAALGVGAVSGIALAVVVLPQIADTLNPTKFGAALLIVFLALLSAAAQRWTECVNRRQEVKDALRAWPPQTLGATDLATLGVYPAVGPDGAAQSYVPRGEDAALRSALRESKRVIVHGPARAGASRAASEAARAELPDVPVVVPVDADALCGLADGTVRLDVPGSQVCIWLDGLDRFVDSLNACGLRGLDSLNDEVWIVATIRSDEWSGLVDGNGQRTDDARALAADSRVIELEARDLRAGPKPGDPVSDAASGTLLAEKPPWRDRGLGVWAALLLAVVVVGVIFHSDFLNPPPVSRQMNDVLSELSADAGRVGDHLVIDQRLQLHSTDVPSWVIVVEDYANHDEWQQAAANSATTRSDELRIYDVVGGWLRLELDFRPHGTGHNAAEWQPLPGAPVADNYAGDNGTQEIIAGYSLPEHAYGALLPLGVQWADGSYHLVTLTSKAPRLSDQGVPPSDVAFRAMNYRTPLTMYTAITNPRFSHLHLTGYRVQGFALDATPPMRLLTGYFSGTYTSGTPDVLELHASQFRTGSLSIGPCFAGNPYCPAPASRQELVVPPSVDFNNALLLAWSKIGTRWFQPVEIVGPCTLGHRATQLGSSCRRGSGPAKRNSEARGNIAVVIHSAGPRPRVPASAPPSRAPSGIVP